MKKIRIWLLCLLGLLAGAAHAADFTQGVSVSGSVATVWFKSNVATSWVDVHYRLNGGTQQNLRMTWQAANARYEQPVAAASGAALSYFFTYNNGSPAYDSASFAYTVGGTTTTPVTGGGSDPVVLPVGSGVMTIQLANATGGAYADAQLYWAIIGYDPVTHRLSHVDKTGRLVAAAVADNGAANALARNGQTYANYFSALSEASWVSIPKISSARLFISVGAPMYIKINTAADGSTGFAGPDLGNASDPNQGVTFEWVEFTLDDSGYHGNTTRVDQFGFPLRTRLIGNDGSDRTLGETESRAALFAAFEAQAPSEFRALVQRPYRIVAPAKGAFKAGQAGGAYFDAYVDQVWSHYAATPLVFSAEAGTFRGQVVGKDFVFTKDGLAGNLFIHGKPGTQAIFEGSGNLASGSAQELVLQAQITAAFNRHLLLAVDPSQWSTPASYYPQAPANYYAKFWHDHSIGGLAYGFCYDDVRGQSSLQEIASPKGLVVTVGW